MTGFSKFDSYITQYFFRASEQTKSEITKLNRQIAQASGEIPLRVNAIKEGVASLVGIKRNY